MPEEDGPPTEDATDDALFGGRVRLFQPRRGHRAGTDAVLLAHALRPMPGELVADVGSASGAVGLMMADRAPEARFVFIDRDAALIDLCRRNIARNGLEDRASAVLADILDGLGPEGVAPESCDVVVTNPPFLDPASSRRSPEPGRAAAHTLDAKLDDWVSGCARLLRSKGSLALIHRADRLTDCLDALQGKFGALEVRPIYVHPDQDAIRILVTGVKGSRAPLRVRPALVLHEAGGGFTPASDDLHRGGPAGLPGES